MWVYRRTDSEQLWAVGIYSPDGQWHTDSDHDSPEKAAERVHYLNGGKPLADTVMRRWAYRASRARAVGLLTHYLRQGVEAKGNFWGSDNCAEVEKMVDELIEAAANAEGSVKGEGR